MTKKIAVIGGGWYGSDVAIVLANSGHQVTLIEKNSDIFSEISGTFGLRRHWGPHYPRSEKTQESCRRGAIAFDKAYPDLIVPHDYSIYAIADYDADKKPSKVGVEDFQKVCEKAPGAKKVDLKDYGYSNLLLAMNIEEPSIAVGKRLSENMKKRLEKAGVKIVTNCKVTKVNQSGEKVIINSSYMFAEKISSIEEEFDYAINATGYQSLISEKKLPFNMNVVYQPCLALEYEDRESTEKPFSFIAMDGLLPCIMPVEDGTYPKENPRRKYILTNGKWTIMHSKETPKEAQEVLSKINDEFILANIKPNCEKEIERFIPNFTKRFEYTKWRAGVILKVRSEKEFRSAITFKESGKNVISILPGKVTNVVDASKEVHEFLNGGKILSADGFEYLEGGVLDQSLKEITEHPDPNDKRNTCNLRTFDEIETQVVPTTAILDKTESFSFSKAETPTTRHGSGEIHSLFFAKSGSARPGGKNIPPNYSAATTSPRVGSSI